MTILPLANVIETYGIHTQEIVNYCENICMICLCSKTKYKNNNVISEVRTSLVVQSFSHDQQFIPKKRPRYNQKPRLL